MCCSALQSLAALVLNAYLQVFVAALEVFGNLELDNAVVET